MKNKKYRSGTGKIHMAVWRDNVKVYDLGCSRLSDLDLILGGVSAGNVDDKEPLTCQRCQKKFPSTGGGKKAVTVHQKKSVCGTSEDPLARSQAASDQDS